MTSGGDLVKAVVMSSVGGVASSGSVNWWCPVVVSSGCDKWW